MNEAVVLGMLPEVLLQPVMALVVVTVMVWIRLYWIRLPEMRRRRIDPQSIAGSVAKAATLQDTRASDNFSNLFEMPVLFYVGVLTFLAADLPVLDVDQGLAWAYVLLRAVHSLIQCTYNRVMHRFVVYLLSSLVLFWFLGRLVIAVFT